MTISMQLGHAESNVVWYDDMLHCRKLNAHFPGTLHSEEEPGSSAAGARHMEGSLDVSAISPLRLLLRCHGAVPESFALA